MIIGDGQCALLGGDACMGVTSREHYYPRHMYTTALIIRGAAQLTK